MRAQPQERAQLRLTDSNLPAYLCRVGLIPPDEEVAVEKPGEGNINWVRRARSARGSWVVKQARPALERFPEYRVSTVRLLCEQRYYELTGPFDRDAVCPRILHFDADERVLVLEDLGDVDRLEDALARGEDVGAAVRALARFLGAVHAGTRRPELSARFANEEMQRLHGDHIFHLPYRPNDFPLSPRVAQRAARLRADAALVARIDAAHARYRAAKVALVHGDAQPSNVLLARTGPKLLDAEIAHVGDPAFDLGILVAHLLLHAVVRADSARGREAAQAAWSAYAEAHGATGLCAFAEVARYAGIELLRRSVGAARAPAVLHDAAALAVIGAATRLVESPPETPAALP